MIRGSAIGRAVAALLAAPAMHIKDLMSYDSGITRNTAKRCRIPNRSDKRTYDFVRRTYSFDSEKPVGLFRCRQTGELRTMPIMIRNPSPKAMEFYA